MSDRIYINTNGMRYLQSVMGGRLKRYSDGTYSLVHPKYGIFFNNGRRRTATGMEDYDYNNVLQALKINKGPNAIPSDFLKDSPYISEASSESNPTNNSEIGDPGTVSPYGGTWLEEINVYGKKPDKKEGPKQRIKEFQKKLGVKVDGIWGKNTENAYQQYLKNKLKFNAPIVNEQAEEKSTPLVDVAHKEAITGVDKFQQGGKSKSDEVKEFQKYIIAEAQSQNKDPETYIKELGEDGLKEAYKRFQEHKKKQAQKAAHGAKLQYFKSLKNKCAEDEQLVYFKRGGIVDCGCTKKAKEGEKITKPTNAVEAFKCGQKIKKNQQGKKFPLIEGKKTVYYKDEATRDSIAANKYNDQEVQTMKPGTYKKNAQGKPQWTPDRTKTPYNKKKK